MLSTTTDRVSNNISQAQHRELERALKRNVSRYLNADQETIDRRIDELNREWSIERAIELEAPLMIGLGGILGLTHSRKWFGLSVFSASMVILHNTQGWYPLLGLFRRMGLRSQEEIEQERMALRALRDDHFEYTRH